MPTMEITTMIGCPLKCNFCPQEELRTAYGNDEKYLSLSNFKKILNKIPKYVRIDFSGMSEPWANKDCTKMLEYALSSGYEVAIYSTLYGMSEIDADEIINLFNIYHNKISIFEIHLQDENKNMLGMRFTDEWIRVFNKFCEFHDGHKLKEFNFMTMDEFGRLDPILKNLGIKVPNFRGITRAGALNLDNIGGQKVIIVKNLKSRIKCSFTSYYDNNVLLPNGDVLLCCNDYAKKHVIGNMLKSDYRSLFRSDMFLNIMAENMNPFGDNDGASICRSCERACSAN